MKKLAAQIVMISLAFGASDVTADAPSIAPLLSSHDEIDATSRKSFYRLSALRLLQRVRFLVEDRYVDPGRIDPEKMFGAALNRVERENPEVLFRHAPGDSLLHVSVNNYTTTMELPAIGRLNEMAEQLERVALILDEQLEESVSRPEVEYALINGMLSTLDPHTVLLPPEQSREMEVENQGEFGGLGITIGIREGRLSVQYPLRDTPAYRAGLEPGDRILRIDDESTVNMSLEEAVSRLRGLVGEPVTISVDRESFEEPRDFTIVRATIRMNPVQGVLMDGGIGYIQIDNFHAATARDLSNLLSSFKRENHGSLGGLVLDLRGNPGGYLHQAIEVADFFIDEGVLVSTVEESRREVTEAHSERTESDYPMVVLVNAHSASASEIVAGALKNHQRAVIVGERTFGKGSVQNLYPNGDESRLKLTIAKYLTPGDQSIQSVGIPPDILLRPSIVEQHTSDDGEVTPLVSLYWRDRLEREADLDRALERVDIAGSDSAFALRYLRSTDDEERLSDEVDVSNDWEVNFARDLIMAAPSYRPAEMLQAAESVIQEYVSRETERVVDAFQIHDIDWSVGEQPESYSISAEINLGDRGTIMSGLEGQFVELAVTNNSDSPIHQLMAVSESTLGWLDGEEFFFGQISPNETRRWRRPLRNIEGYTAQTGELNFNFQDASGTSFGEHSELIEIEGAALPSFSWTSVILDSGVDGVIGDGDGVPETGETVVLRLEVTNCGEGAAAEPFVKLRNLAGHDLDLQVGTVELGTLGPGESAFADLVFEIRGEESEINALPVELTVGDNVRFDYNAVMSGGFYSFFSQVKELEIVVGSEHSWEEQTPPALEITRTPELSVNSSTAVLSGVVNDDHGIRDLQIYHGENKIFYQGGGDGVRSLPFTADLNLEEGDNLVVVLARDEDGLTDVRSVNVYYRPE